MEMPVSIGKRRTFLSIELQHTVVILLRQEEQQVLVPALKFSITLDETVHLLTFPTSIVATPSTSHQILSMRTEGIFQYDSPLKMWREYSLPAFVCCLPEDAGIPLLQSFHRWGNPQLPA